MSNHIPINTSVRLGGQLSNFIINLRDVISRGNNLRDIMAQCISGSDYSDVDAQFGLTPTGTGTNSTGYDVWFQLDTINTQLNSDAIKQFLAQLG